MNKLIWQIEHDAEAKMRWTRCCQSDNERGTRWTEEYHTLHRRLLTTRRDEMAWTNDNCTWRIKTYDDCRVLAGSKTLQ